MQSALEKELSARIASWRFRLRDHDRIVLLGVGLCFAPFPPAFIVGLVLAGLNFTLARHSLQRSEIRLLRAGTIVALAYIAIWAGLIFWAVRAGGLAAIAGFVNGWALWLEPLLHPGGLRSAPSIINRV